MDFLLKLFSNIFSSLCIPTIIAIAWLLSVLGVDWKKHLKEFFRTEEKPLNNEQELNKTRAEINKAKIKEEKWPI